MKSRNWLGNLQKTLMRRKVSVAMETNNAAQILRDHTKSEEGTEPKPNTLKEKHLGWMQEDDMGNPKRQNELAIAEIL